MLQVGDKSHTRANLQRSCLFLLWIPFRAAEDFHFSVDDADGRDLSAPPMDCSSEKPLQNGIVGEEEEKEDGDKKPSSEEDQSKKEEKQRQKKKYVRLSRLRRRRCARKDGQEDESDLSEGFESDEEEDNEEERQGRADSTGGISMGSPVNPSSVKKETKRDPLGEEVIWGSGSEEEEGGTAFDVETDSDMNSQESRSDLEDIEDTENSEAREHQEEEEDAEHAKEGGGGGDADGDLPPNSNGPSMPSDASISSNLQAMSSQLFQTKRCFRLAPTFSNMLLRPQASSSSGIPTPTDTSAPPSQETPPPSGDSPCDLNPGTANGTNDDGNLRCDIWRLPHLLKRLKSSSGGFFSSDLDSDSEESQHSAPSVRSEKTLLEKLEILTNQGLIQVVKVFVDWLRTNTDIIVMCAQVRLQIHPPFRIHLSGV